MTNISTSGFFDTAIYNMNTLQSQVNNLQESISTGNKYTSSNEAPAAAAQMRALTLGDTLASADTANADATKNSLSLADTSLSQVTSLVTQIHTLTTQAANGALNDTQRGAIGTQIGQLYQNLVNLANTKDASGNAIFAGNGAGNAYTLDAAGNPTYAGTATANTVSLGGGLDVTTGVTGPQVFNYTDASGHPQSLLSVINNLATALQGGGAAAQAAAQTGLDQLTAGLAQVTTAQTIVGARANWVTTTTTIQTQLNQQRTASESRVGDTDIASATAQLAQVTTILSAAQATFVKVAGMSLFSLLQ